MSLANDTTTLVIEGRRVVVQIAVDEHGTCWADFVLAESLSAFSAKNRTGDSPWFELAGWLAPRAALLAIWHAVIALSAGRPVGIEASSDKRAAVYCRMLQRNGIEHTAIRLDADDTMIMIGFKK